jgi:predicted dehydrogenase
LNVAIVGCGLVGRKRAQALAGARLAACVDTSLERASALAALFPGAAAGVDWRTVVALPDIALVVVATTNDVLAEVGREAVGHGKHVLIEKPGGCSVGEIDRLDDAVLS